MAVTRAVVGPWGYERTETERGSSGLTLPGASTEPRSVSGPHEVKP